jgi:hypothetical protein
MDSGYLPVLAGTVVGTYVDITLLYEEGFLCDLPISRPLDTFLLLGTSWSGCDAPRRNDRGLDTRTLTRLFPAQSSRSKCCRGCSCRCGSAAGSNGFFFCNEDVDQVLDEAKNASPLDTYAEIQDQVQTIITSDDVPVIAGGQPQWTTVLHNSVKGFAFNPMNLGTYDFWSRSRKG